jgi:hypothetical protein
VAYTPAIDRALVALGCSANERSEISRRLANGYAIEALTPGSVLVGGPPLELLIDSLKARYGGDVSEAAITAALAWLTRARAASELSAAGIYKRAVDNYEEVLKKTSPPKELHRSVCGIQLPPPPFAFADALERKGLEEVFAGVRVDRKTLTLSRLIEIMKHNGSLASDESQVKNIAWILASIARTNDLHYIGPEHIALYRLTLELMPKFYGRSNRYQQRTLQDIILSTEILPKNQIGLARGAINRHLSQAGKLVNAALQEGFAICEPAALFALRVKATQGPATLPASGRQQKEADFMAALAAGIGRVIARWRVAPNIRTEALDVIFAARVRQSLDERPDRSSPYSERLKFTLADAALVVAGWRSGRILFDVKWL